MVAVLRPRSIVLLILLLGVAYTLAMFRGLENHPGYFGSAYQVIYPGSFPNDPFMAPDRPVRLSLYYGLVRWAGPVWLDDRFTLVLFFVMTLLSLLCLDKTACLLGANRPAERAALLALVLLEHQFFITHVLLVDNYGFNGTALGGACALWLLYASLAGWNPLAVLALVGLCLAVSMKNTWLPVLISLFLLWKEQLGPRSKRFWLFGACGIASAAVAYYYVVMRPARGTDAVLFDYILRFLDDVEANPFWYPLWCNLFFMGFCLLTFLVRDLPPTLLSKVRSMAVMGLLAWFLGGVYLTCAPDLLKLPQGVPFDLRRALRWPSYIVFIAVAVHLLKRLQRASSAQAWILCWVGLMALYLLHVEFRANLAGMIFVLTAVLVWAYVRWDLGRLEPAQRLRIVAISLVAGTLALYGVGAVHRRSSALMHLARYGILGDNPCAKWVGVNEYIRRSTPPSATVLAMSLEDSQRKPSSLRFDGSLRTRAGRSMPMGHRASFYFDYAKLLWWEKRNRIVQELAHQWESEDAEGSLRSLSDLGPPDYLVVPTTKSTWVRQARGFPYRSEAMIGEFSILHRDHVEGIR